MTNTETPTQTLPNEGLLVDRTPFNNMNQFCACTRLNMCWEKSCVFCQNYVYCRRRNVGWFNIYSLESFRSDARIWQLNHWSGSVCLKYCLSFSLTLLCHLSFTSYNFIASHILHVIVMSTFFQALNRKTTQLNQKQISGLAFHPAFRRFSPFNCRFVAWQKGLPRQLACCV